MTDSIKMTHPDAPSGYILVPPGAVENMQKKGWQVTDPTEPEILTPAEETENG